eukprot:4907970-Alexandrium_andersonii.AAC.1
MAQRTPALSPRAPPPPAFRATRRAISRKTGWQALGTFRRGANGRRRRSARSHSRVWSRYCVHCGSSRLRSPACPAFSSASWPLSGVVGTLGWLEAPGGRRSSEIGVSASGGKKRPGPGPEAS